jgi:hypothetical protein
VVVQSDAKQWCKEALDLAENKTEKMKASYLKVCGAGDGSRVVGRAAASPLGAVGVVHGGTSVYSANSTKHTARQCVSGPERAAERARRRTNGLVELVERVQWHCVVGADFKASFSHESKTFIFLSVGKTNVLLYKT